MGLISTPGQRWAVVALGYDGEALARRIAAQLSDSTVHVRTQPGRIAAEQSATGEDAAGPPSVAYQHVAEHLQRLFAQDCCIVAVAAAGIVIRALAPVLRDKHHEPAVLAVSHDGATVVPLLGGHAARANATAVELGGALGANAAITTASESQLGVALDCPPEGVSLANVEHHKAFARALRNGTPVHLSCPADCDDHWLREAQFTLVAEADAAHLQIITTVDAHPGSEQCLVYHPRQLAVGVGCARGTEADEIHDLIVSTLAQVGLSVRAVAGLFSVHHKLDEPGLHEVAKRLGVSCRFFAPERLEQERDRLENPSARVFAEVGCHGVAEGAALAAVGDNGTLRVAKYKTANATCAIGFAPDVIAADAVGQGRGELFVVGVGPGAMEYRAPAASAAIHQADDVVGYGLYLDLVDDLLEHQKQHRYPLGKETERVRDAISLAARGRKVALVCSGDAGIYAMASLVCELLETSADASWGRVHMEVVPGVSAMQLASGRAGAMLGHDFCAISLSDLLTPREVIEQRLHAANAGDFVIALYNPISRQRVQTFELALEVLRAGRAPDTVVVVARELGRPDEALLFTTLGELRAGDLDMLSIVLVGSSNSRSGRSGYRELAYTPRGYRAPATIQRFEESNT